MILECQVKESNVAVRNTLRERTALIMATGDGDGEAMAKSVPELVLVERLEREGKLWQLALLWITTKGAACPLVLVAVSLTVFVWLLTRHPAASGQGLRYLCCRLYRHGVSLAGSG